MSDEMRHLAVKTSQDRRIKNDKFAAVLKDL